jgi:hypothetical protein
MSPVSPRPHARRIRRGRSTGCASPSRRSRRSWTGSAARGESLRYHIARLLTLLDDYGPQELATAIDRALERDAFGAGAIAHLLETRAGGSAG